MEASLTKIETREVLADAYGRRNNFKGRTKRMLSHAVEVNTEGFATAVLCKRVTLDNLADRGASDPGAPPTCEACQRALARRLR